MNLVNVIKLNFTPNLYLITKYGIIKRLFIGLSDMYKVKQMIKKNNL